MAQIIHQTEDGPKWETVGKNKKKKPSKRSDSVIIKPDVENRYFGTLKNLRQNMKPEETEVAIRSTNKTKTAAIILVIAKGGGREKFMRP